MDWSGTSFYGCSQGSMEHEKCIIFMTDLLVLVGTSLFLLVHESMPLPPKYNVETNPRQFSKIWKLISLIPSRRWETEEKFWLIQSPAKPKINRNTSAPWKLLYLLPPEYRIGRKEWEWERLICRTLETLPQLSLHRINVKNFIWAERKCWKARVEQKELRVTRNLEELLSDPVMGGSWNAQKNKKCSQHKPNHVDEEKRLHGQDSFPSCSLASDVTITHWFHLHACTFSISSTTPVSDTIYATNRVGSEATSGAKDGFFGLVMQCWRGGKEVSWGWFLRFFRSLFVGRWRGSSEGGNESKEITQIGKEQGGRGRISKGKGGSSSSSKETRKQKEGQDEFGKSFHGDDGKVVEKPNGLSGEQVLKHKETIYIVPCSHLPRSYLLLKCLLHQMQPLLYTRSSPLRHLCD